MSRARPGSALLDDVHELVGQRIRVHFNLHTHLWSVTALTGARKGRVVANLRDVTLRAAADKAVTFHVSRAGWEKCRRKGSRDVHAWCTGTVQALDSGPDLHALSRVTYSPWRDPWFEHTGTGAPVHTADLVVFAKLSADAKHGYAWI